MTRTYAPPAMEDLDGVACGAVADYDVCEPFTWIGGSVVVEDHAIFYELYADQDGLGGGSTVNERPRYMVVEPEDRNMVVTVATGDRNMVVSN